MRGQKVDAGSEGRFRCLVQPPLLYILQAFHSVNLSSTRQPPSTTVRLLLLLFLLLLLLPLPLLLLLLA